jgi:arylesterase/paraoxonase
VLLFASLGPYLADRYKLVYIVYSNHPSRLKTTNAFTSYDIKFKDQLRNCEDVILDETKGYAYLSCDPGRDRWNRPLGVFIDPYWQHGWIYTFDYASKGKAPEPMNIERFDDSKTRGFHPLGLALHSDSQTLYAINHAEDGPSIEVFSVSKDGKTLTYRRTIEHPLLHAPNFLVPISHSELYVTNDHRWPARTYGLLSKIETTAAYPGGSINYLDLRTNIVRKLHDIPFANGIGLLNESHVVVASTTLPALYVFSKVYRSTNLHLEKRIRTDFLPDNLSVDGSGKLLIAGHPYGLAIGPVAHNTHKYNMDNKDSSLLPEDARPRSSSWVAEWDGNEEGKLRDLYISHEYGTSTTAVRDVKRGVGIIGGLYEKGILVWKE